MKQTPLQKLITLLEQRRSYFQDRELDAAIHHANHLLEYEQQEIEVAYNEGYRDGNTDEYVSDYPDVSEFQNAKIYFKERYK